MAAPKILDISPGVFEKARKYFVNTKMTRYINISPFNTLDCVIMTPAGHGQKPGAPGKMDRFNLRFFGQCILS